jgi:UDP-GlcNAc:undecaprenyl-phosphate GlcNAc-1-phosphate transferase
MRLDVPHPLLLLAFLGLCLGWYWLTSRRARAVALFARLGGRRAVASSPAPAQAAVEPRGVSTEALDQAA